MNKINFEDLPSENTPISASNLNLMQTNMENALNQAITDMRIENINFLQEFEFDDNTAGQLYYNLKNLYTNNLTKKEIGYTTNSSASATPTYLEVNTTSGNVSTGIQNAYAYPWVRLTYSDVGVVTINADKYGTRFSVYMTSGGQACFEGNTEVLTPMGLVAIKDLKLNDEIVTQNGNKRIFKKYEHIINWLYIIHVKNEIIKCSYSHPFLTQRGYVNAIELTENDVLKDKDGNELHISEIEVEAVDMPVYEINTNDADDYYVTASKILVGSEILM